ncbi:MAG TPA: thiamine pyrophosphate-dependent dehydrogenase E1 component subunit alpha [Acidimicrobiales bacterium]|nr:thiamine pyrophosphate-dependent dehydrogenase E1 component subunit alpha [Acidimicrobiales bacterium]
MHATGEQMVEMYRRMVRIRLFEDATIEHRSEIPGVCHTSVGMEASIVGSCMALRRDDYMVGTHRSHGHPIGKGANVDGLVAELLGKVTGVNAGKGGSMHLSDFSVGSLGETSIVGSGLPVATGAALGAKMQGLDRVALCFFGDGAAAEGTFHESLNLAAIWELPVVYVCENNGYGELSSTSSVCSVDNISQRAAGYSMPGVTVDGQDAGVVYDAVSEAVERARSGGGPTLVETKTYRLYGHTGGPDAKAAYRSQEEVDEWWKRDPVALWRERLRADGVLSDAAIKEIDEEEHVGIEAAWAFARSSAYPEPDAAFDHLFTTPIAMHRQG